MNDRPIATRSASRFWTGQFWILSLLALVITVLSCSRKSSESQIDSQVLESCAGRYEAAPDTIVTVRRKGESLVMEVNSGSPMEFRSESKDGFIHKQSGVKISFARDAHGQVTDLIMYRNGEHRARRIADSASQEKVQTVNVDGTDYRTVVSGHGKIPVVLVSGLQNWAVVRSGIEAITKVVGYEADGIRAPGRVPLDARTQAQRLDQLLKALEVVAPCVFVGHSYGGALVRIYADLYPERVAGLILVDPFHEGFVDWLKVNQPENYEIFRQRATASYVSDWEQFLGRLRPARLPRGIPVVLLTADRRQIRENDALEQKITPVAFAEGTRAVMKAHQEWIATVPQGKHVVVPDAGHEIPKEQPGFVIAAIKATLNQIAGDKERLR